MSSFRTLVIGSDAALDSPRAEELFALLTSHSVSFTQVQDVQQFQSLEEWDLVFVLDWAHAQSPQTLLQHLKNYSSLCRCFILYETQPSIDWSELSPQAQWSQDESIANGLKEIFTPSEEIDAFADLQLENVVSSIDSNISSQENDLNSLADSLFNDDSIKAPEDQELHFEGVALSLDSDEAKLDSSDSPFISTEENSISLSPNESDEIKFGDLISHPDVDISTPLAGRETFNAELKIDDVFASNTPKEDAFGSSIDSGLQENLSYQSLDSNDSPSSESSDEKFSSFQSPNKATQAHSELNISELQTLQKYAALKEREAREKEATIQVLKGQLSKLESKYLKSETERRRLTLESEEIRNQLSTVEEELNQKKFHLQKIEGNHQEEIRSLNIRLDNAVFQANKSQNRFEDFREKVKNDFVKIRTQERELFNKLDLQKRDAEALLASKDEQLLNQRREIDRLQYDIESLRERVLEDTEKAEERSARLSRAVQSLKLANDMLSGLTEEVLPSSGDHFGDSQKSSGDEAA